MQHATLIAALLTERSGYVRRNLHARVAAVDEQLRSLGVVRETAALEPSDERAVMPKPRKRKR